ncbi:MAG: hypothetical protein F4Y38_00080 [Gemmatimonadetes bacterium]|nr:hypothetical protein [Gemmatimonadota bacterium]MYG83705.1 hypothetical protein [Gemmatimonadota bacterium]MYJ91078.1 hypothetical protein [Gemmatimonadota bacterium]
MASYDWIEIQGPQDYDQLIEVLDPEFGPKKISQHLKLEVTAAVKGVLVEHGYVDKDYRSTFYNFYTKKGRQYRADCVRLHFFDGSVLYDDVKSDIKSTDERPQDHYFGYIVLRPTIVATLGRSVLSPNIRLGAHGSAIQSPHTVNLLGHQLPIWGFPSMAQHVDIAVCAHVACWAILRYYSETFPQHREYLVHDITQLVAPFDPGGLVPSLGFNVDGAERVFQASGCYPLVVGKCSSSSDEAFFSQMLAYLESGFPLFVAMHAEEHAIVAVGYSWLQKPILPSSSSSHVWSQVDNFLAVDDNLLPYSTVTLNSTGTPSNTSNYTADSFDAFVVALPDKVYYPADAIEVFSKEVEDVVTRMCSSQTEPLQLRRYFITTISRLREDARVHHSQLGDTLVGLMMHLDTAQYVWVVEYCSFTQWQTAHVAARVIVDATASHWERYPMWLLHNGDVAYVFDRSSVEMNPTAIDLARTGLGPLPRIELNLRPVLESPAPLNTITETSELGGEK